MNRPSPPAGYATWLDYAVETMDTRTPYLDQLLGDAGIAPDRSAMEQAVRDELTELRMLALKNHAR